RAHHTVAQWLDLRIYIGDEPTRSHHDPICVFQRLIGQLDGIDELGGDLIQRKAAYLLKNAGDAGRQLGHARGDRWKFLNPLFESKQPDWRLWMKIEIDARLARHHRQSLKLATEPTRNQRIHVLGRAALTADDLELLGLEFD